MEKRFISIIVVFSLLFSGICVRLYSIATNPIYANAQKSLRVRDIDYRRGFIYDRNLEPLTNNAFRKVICLKPCEDSFQYLSDLRGKQFASDTLGKGYFTTLSLNNDEAPPTNSEYLILDIYERYGDSLALHIIGYTDADNNGVCGVEKYYNNELKNTCGEISLTYQASATERMLTDSPVEIRDNGYYQKGGIALTLDRTIQSITERALLNGDINKGGAIVLDVKTSAILACASTPIFHRNNIEKSLSDENAPFINRAFSAYPVGSVFKSVTAASAIENSIPLENFYCNGSIEKSGNVFNCNKKEGHGNLDFNNALALSCNPYFINLGTMTGGEKLLNTAQKLGFGKATDVGNGFFTDSGTLPDKSLLNSDAAVGNLGFGQGYLTATPLQIATCYATFANGGIYNPPHIYSGKVNPDGSFSPERKTDGKRILKTETCEQIKEALLQTTLTGTGKTAFSSLFDSCTKTATAQSGRFDENGNEINYSWFVGFFPYNDPQYVICVIKENGSSGSTDGAPVYKEIAENIYIYDYS